MANDERTQELMERLYDAVVNMDEDTVREVSQAAVDEGIDAFYTINQG